MRSKIKGHFEPLTDLEIEEYLCGDAAPSVVARVDDLARGSAELREYLAERRAEQTAFFVQHPVLKVQLPEPARHRRTRWLALGVGALAGAMALGAMLIVVGGKDAEPVAWHIQSRGGLKATLAVRREGRVFAHRAGLPLRQGDQVRLSIESPTSGFVTVLGPGKDGELAAYYEAIAVSAGTFAVPDSLVLDDHVGEEEWLVLLTPAPLSAREAIARVERKEPLEASTTVLRIVKEAP